MRLNFQIADFGSELYQESVSLRTAVLRTPLGLTFSKEYLSSEKDQLHLVACEDKKVCGVALLQTIDEEVCKLRQFAVEENLQGKGIGKQLLQFFEEIAAKNGFSQVSLHARKSACLFYEKRGYQAQGELFKEVGIDHYKMIKNLDELFR